jgi:bifunctional endo-1,4-beta-xylanase xylA, putative
MNYDIKSIKNKMLVKYPFFGSVIADVKYEEDKSLGTAGTNGQIIYYNPDYLNCLSKEEQTFVFAHEVCHIAFNHILRSEGKDVNLWNIATDGVINQFLKRDGLKMPEGGVDIADALNYDAEQLYEKLLQEKQQNQENQQNSQEHQNQQNNSKSNNNQKNGNSQNSNKDQQGDGSQKQNSEKSQNGQDSNQISSNSKNKENSQSSEDSQEQSNNQNNSQINAQQNNSKSNNNQKNDNSQNSKNNQQSADVNGSKENASQQDISDTKNSQQSDKQSKDSNNDDKKHKDVGHDTHSMWEETVKKHKEQEQNKEKKNNEINKKNKNSSEKDDFEKKQEELENMGEKKAFKKNLEDRKKQLEELKEAISKLASQAGSTSNEDVREIENIGISKPLIDWRYILREAIKYDVDWSYQNATIEDGVITPNLEEQPKPETEIVLDTSGSISDVLLRNFLRECKNILQQSRVKVGCFDTKFYGFHEIRTEQDIENMKFVGGGGTDFYVAINAFTRRVENKIIFTDGEAWMPNIPCDAIWIVFGQTKINPKGGKVIYITPEQLDKLYGFDFNDNVRKRVK